MENRNLKISGAGTCCGGEYDLVKISGAGTVKGDILCNEFHSSGAADIRGNVNAKIMRCSGASHFFGDVYGGEMKFSGAADVEGNISGESVKISGGADVKRNVNCDYIKISGGAEIGGDCEGDHIEISGGVVVRGLLNGSKIEVSVGGRCSATEVGGEVIHVFQRSKNGGFFSKLFKSIDKDLRVFRCESIEGDEIRLEATECKVVRGKNVVVGKDCRIDRIEYTDFLETIDGAEVGEIVKL